MEFSSSVTATSRDFGFALPAGKRVCVAPNEIGSKALDVVEHQGCPRSMAMAVITAFAERAVLGEMGFEAVAVDIVRSGSLGKFPQVVQQGGESDATRAVEKIVLVVHVFVLIKP